MGKAIVFCKCGGERVPSERLQAIEASLEGVGAEVVVLSDLCLLSVLGKEKLQDLFHEGTKYLLIGCYERSMKLILEQTNPDNKNLNIDYINFLELRDAEINRSISQFCGGADEVHSFREITLSTEWKSWFPVVDYSRCSACGQCHDFCLFGVYEKREGKVVVVQPQSCKNNCPACARICPGTAIIFPKYTYGGAIGGSEITNEEAEQDRQSADIKTILAGDIYSALEQRKNRRHSIIRNEAMKKALEDRDNALNLFKMSE
jgi:NAD-dependent dihydropyrimidine dehydrogenase PreA subunit